MPPGARFCNEHAWFDEACGISVVLDRSLVLGGSVFFGGARSVFFGSFSFGGSSFGGLRFGGFGFDGFGAPLSPGLPPPFVRPLGMLSPPFGSTAGLAAFKMLKTVVRFLGTSEVLPHGFAQFENAPSPASPAL